MIVEFRAAWLCPGCAIAVRPGQRGGAWAACCCRTAASPGPTRTSGSSTFSLSSSLLQLTASLLFHVSPYTVGPTEACNGHGYVPCHRPLAAEFYFSDMNLTSCVAGTDVLGPRSSGLALLLSRPHVSTRAGTATASQCGFTPENTFQGYYEFVYRSACDFRNRVRCGSQPTCRLTALAPGQAYAGAVWVGP